MNNYFDKNLIAAKKFVDIILNIDELDKQVEDKFINNQRDLKFYNDLLDDANKHFFNIVKNLKNTL